MKNMIIALALGSLAGCVATPQAVAPGPFASEAGFSVPLENSWSQWAPSINFQTQGEFLTKDGVGLNRLHLVSLEDGDAFVKAVRDTDLPKYTASSSEIDIADFVASSFTRIGYSSMEAEAIEPATFDGNDGISFKLSGKTDKGLNVVGDAAAVKLGDDLKLVVFLAPEMHYYDASAEEVSGIISGIDFPGGES